MTWEELNGVRNLNQTVCGIEKRLRALRVAAENIVPILDGLPHAAIAHSQVEKIALKIVESERELEQNLRILTERKAELADKIMSEFAQSETQTLLTLRYVECCTFKEVAHRMQYALRHVFKLHEQILKEGICGHIDAQN